MAVLAIVTSSPASTEGGHLVIARALAEAACAAGHDARLVVTPDYGFGRLTRSYLANWRTDVAAEAGAHVDQVISFRYPSFAVRHPVHVCWLNHPMREYYDLWPRFSAELSWGNRVKEGARRRTLHCVDRWLLTRNVTKVIAQSDTIQRRLADSLGIRAERLWPPAPPRPYRCDGYGDFVFAPSRLAPLKRLDLLIRTLAEPSARRVRAVIAGEGASCDDLARLAGDLGVADRVTMLGRIGDEALVSHLARCRAVWFTPFDEDYGFVTVEAFRSGKAVITCLDSGGPTELVRNGETGFVCSPDPASLATALTAVMDDRALAERMGTAASRVGQDMTWSAAVARLVIA